MKGLHPHWTELPTVRAALRWLLPPAHNAADRTLSRRAQTLGLIRNLAGATWQADGPAVARRAQAAFRRLPDDPAQLGDIVHGLGEIAARSHVALVEPLVSGLRRRRGLRWDRVFAMAFARQVAIRHPVQLDAVAVAQWLSRGTTASWDTLALAQSHVEHGHGLIGGGYYGLAFAARVVLALDARAVDTCIEANPNAQCLAAIANAALALVFPFDGKAQPALLLRSRNAAIRSLGAVALLCPPEIMGAPIRFRDCRTRLLAGGIEPSDATWMMGLRVKESVHGRYRLEDARRNRTARLRSIEKDPHAAPGGVQNAAEELLRLRRQLESDGERYAKLLSELESMVSDLAADWPADGLSDEQMAWLDTCFVDTAEFRHRLAQKLASGANRDWLLKRNIARLRDFIGLSKNADEIPTEYFLPDERRFLPLSEWTSQSLSLLYETDKRGVGKRTSDIVFGVYKAATTLFAQPFVDARKPEASQSILTRAACAYRFALMVVATAPEHGREAVSGLNGIALESTFELLSRSPASTHMSEPLFHLTALAIHNMRSQPEPDDVRGAWGLAETLPDFARALALWSSPALVTKYDDLASGLFRRVGELPLSQQSQNLVMSQMLCLLDAAISSCAAAGRIDLIPHVVSLWHTIYENWHAVNDTWANSADMLASAVAKDGPDRTQLLTDPAFARSYCTKLIAVLSAAPQ